jgi:hypothetical protein
MEKKKVVFIADDSIFSPKCVGKTNNSLINALSSSNLYHINIFYTHQNVDYILKNVLNLKPALIIVFEIGELRHPNLEFIFELKIPICLFLDDTYYLTSTSSLNQFSYLTNRVDCFIHWYKSKSAQKSYLKVYPKKIITNLSSRFVNTHIYKDSQLEKKYDILIYGTRSFKYPYKKEQVVSIQNYITSYEKHNNVTLETNSAIDFYPLRVKLENIINNNLSKWRVRILPETSIQQSVIANENLSMLINQSYLTLACPSIADVLMHKFLEIAASKSVILGKYPSDYKNLFEGNIIEVDEFMEEERIVKIIDDALADKKKLEEMSERLYKKVHEEHNLDKAIENFNEVMDGIITTLCQ